MCKGTDFLKHMQEKIEILGNLRKKGVFLENPENPDRYANPEV